MSPDAPRLPEPRGPISEQVVAALRRAPGPLRLPRVDGADLLVDDDAQLALSCAYGLHYDGFAGVDDDWEWAPSLLAATAMLERAFVGRLCDEVGAPRRTRPHRVAAELSALTAGDGPSLSEWMLERGTRTEMQEFVVHRSAYQRKEADGHTFAIPRLRGRSKAAYVTIQHDEYGAGTAADVHAELFATTMRAFGLDPTPGAYLDRLPGVTLATDNLVTLFGMHRRWRAACVGHLALFEMTSIGPMRRYSETLRRLGFDEAARRFYDVHVEADAWHERIAEQELVTSLVRDDPAAAGVLLFGARALTNVEARLAGRLLDAWDEDRSSLYGPEPLEQPQRSAAGAGH